MECTLVLMRHGHAEEVSGVHVDHDRHLTHRGRGEAKATALWLKEQGITPQVIYASSAARVQETVAEVLTVFPGVEVSTHAGLYMSAPRQYTLILSKTSSHVVMMVGHNPGISHLASELSARDVYFRTAGAAIITYENETWDQIASGTAEAKTYQLFS